MNPDVFPSSDCLRKAGDLMTPGDPPPELDLSEIAKLAAHDAAHRILEIRQAFRYALEKIEALAAAGFDHQIALGGGIQRATDAAKDTAYREAIFRACCAYFNLSYDEANSYVERYRKMKSAMKE